eukprot:7744887-Pyramimonas_sp.AAC.1
MVGTFAPQPATVNCEPLSSSTVQLTQQLDGFAKGIHLSPDRQLYFGLFNHSANQSAVLRIKDAYRDADIMEILVIEVPDNDMRRRCVSNVVRPSGPPLKPL